MIHRSKPPQPKQTPEIDRPSEFETVEDVAVERQISIGNRLRSPQTLVSFGLAILFIFLILRNLNLDLRMIFTNIRTANPIYLVGAFAVYYVAFPLRAIRWRILLTNAGISQEQGYPVPPVRGLSIIYLLGWFANCLVPAKLGDAYRGYLLKKNASPSFSKTIGTIFAERIVDIFALVGIIITASILIFRGSIPSSIQAPLAVGALLVGVAIAGLFAITRYSDQIRGVMPERVRPYYIRVDEGLRTSFARNGLGKLIGLTAVLWSMEGLRVLLVAAAFSVLLAPAEAVFVALLASLLTVVPLTPAGLGVVEGGTIVALKLLGVDDIDAATIAFVDRLIAYWSVILVGAIVYGFTKYK